MFFFLKDSSGSNIDETSCSEAKWVLLVEIIVV